MKKIKDKHTLNYPYDPWCNTCERTISMTTWNENDGECDKCKQWWEQQTLEMKEDYEAI